MKFVDRLKFAATGTSAASIADGAAVSSCRNLAAAVTAGVLALTDTAVPIVVDDGAGNWELSLFNLGGTAAAPTLTRTQVLASSAGGTTAATFTGATLTVFNTIPSSFLNGVSLGQLSNAASLSATDVLAVGQSGNEVQTTIDAIYTYLVNRMTAEGRFNSGAASETLTVTKPSTQVAGATFTLSGTYAGTTPTALEFSVNGGTTYTTATGTISGGTYTITNAVVPSANTVQTIIVRDKNTPSVTVTSGSFIVNPNTVLTVNTPTTQTVGTAFTLSGGYTGTAPVSLDYQKEDGTWVQASSPTISGGTWSFSLTPTTATASRTISVREHTYTTIVGTSGTYAVNASSGGSGPTLSALKEWATGSTSAIGNVNTTGTDGTIYWLYATSSTATPAQVKAGSSKAVTAAGVVTLPGTGLTAATAYYLHVIHTSAAAADSAVVSTTTTVTTAPASGAPVATVYGTAIKASLSAADAYGISNGKELYTGTNTGGGTWTFNVLPSTGSTGWSQDNVTPPAAIPDRTLGNNGMVNMTLAASASAGSTSAAYLYVPTGSGTTTWYLWMELNGVYTVKNPSGTVVTL